MLIVTISLVLILLALFGTPLFAVIGALGIISFYLADVDVSALIIEMYRLASAPTIIAIPLFTFAGYMLAESKTPKRLVNLSHALFGWLPGGLALVVLVTCAFFTAFTGASGITIIALGGLLYPILIKDRFSDRFSLGLLTSSGSLGLLFPPSLPLILYALVAKVSVDKLFIAGVLPGILRILLITGYSINKGVAFKVVKTAFSFRKLFNSLREAAWEIPLPFIIIGGIYGGIFTATEAAAVTAFYVLIVEVFIYRDLKLFRDIPAVIVKSMMLVGGILIILGTSLGFTGYLIDQQIPMQVLDFVKAAVESKFTFLIILNIFLLITGCVVDIFSAIIIVVPLITPIALNFGVDPVHLGIIFLTNLEIGYITPPVGLNLFISSFRFEKPVLKLYTSTLPFLLLMLLGLIIITYFPDLSLVLVRIWEGR